MSDTPKKSKRNSKASKATLEIAEAISLEVAPSVAEVAEEAKPAPKKAESPKKEEPVVEVAKVAQSRSVKVKAVKTMRGQVGPYIYDIKAGETYTLPASVALWLIDKGRAI
jgi:hypothetical protein